MRMRVIVNTHKRPAQALAVIECLRALASGLHEVSYVLAYDEEDRITSTVLIGRQACLSYIELDCRPRPVSLQDCWNRNMTPPFEHDIYLPMPDDGFCAVDCWDDLIVQTIQAAPMPELAVIGWHDTACPDMMTVPIATRGWLEAIYPAPLLENSTDPWFADTAVAETWSFAFGFTPPRPSFLRLVTKPNNFNPMLAQYDPDEMWDGFEARRAGRLKIARRIREQYALPPVDDEALAKLWAERAIPGRAHLKMIVERMRNGWLDNRLDNLGQQVAA